MHFKAAGCRGSVGDYVAFWQVHQGQAVSRCLLCQFDVLSLCDTLLCLDGFEKMQYHWMVLGRV